MFLKNEKKFICLNNLFSKKSFGHVSSKSLKFIQFYNKFINFLEVKTSNSLVEESWDGPVQTVEREESLTGQKNSLHQFQEGNKIVYF